MSLGYSSFFLIHAANVLKMAQNTISKLGLLYCITGAFKELNTINLYKKFNCINSLYSHFKIQIHCYKSTVEMARYHNFGFSTIPECYTPWYRYHR